ncbi:hypothetical protein L9F63_028118, partial [Diploptera punctata]
SVVSVSKQKRHITCHTEYVLRRTRSSTTECFLATVSFIRCIQSSKKLCTSES